MLSLHKDDFSTRIDGGSSTELSQLFAKILTKLQPESHNLHGHIVLEAY